MTLGVRGEVCVYVINEHMKRGLTLSHCSQMGLKHTERDRDDEIIRKHCQKKRRKTECWKNIFFIFFKSIEKETTGTDPVKRAHTLLHHSHVCGEFRPLYFCKPPTLFVTHTIIQRQLHQSFVWERKEGGHMTLFTWKMNIGHTWTSYNGQGKHTCYRHYFCMCSRTLTCQSLHGIQQWRLYGYMGRHFPKFWCKVHTRSIMTSSFLTNFPLNLVAPFVQVVRKLN